MMCKKYVFEVSAGFSTLGYRSRIVNSTMLVALVLLLMSIVSCGDEQRLDKDLYDAMGIGIDDPNFKSDILTSNHGSFWGPYRDEVTLEDSGQMPMVNGNPDSPGVLGSDERKFTAIREDLPGEKFKRKIVLKPNSSYEIYIYFKNNSPDLEVTSPIMNMIIPSTVSGSGYIEAGIRSQNQQPPFIYSDVIIETENSRSISIDPKGISFYTIDGELQNGMGKELSERSVDIGSLKRGERLLCDGRNTFMPNCAGFAILRFETKPFQLDYLLKGRNSQLGSGENSDGENPYGNYIMLSRIDGEVEVELLAQLINRSALDIEEPDIFYGFSYDSNKGSEVLEAKWAKAWIYDQNAAKLRGENVEASLTEDSEGQTRIEHYNIKNAGSLPSGKMLEVYYKVSLSDAWVKRLCEKDEGYLRFHFKGSRTGTWGYRVIRMVPDSNLCPTN